MLRDAHAPAKNGAASGAVHISGGANLRLAQARLLLKQCPGFSTQVIDQRFKTNGMFGNKGVVNRRLARVFARQQVFHHAFGQRKIATNAQLEIMGADGGCAQRSHFNLVLRVGKALQATLFEWVERHNFCATFVGRTQLAQHARVIGARVLAEDKYRIGFFKIIEGYRALAHADLLTHAHTAGLVAHVGAIGEVVGAVFAHKQLVQKGCFVAGAARGVKDRLVGVGQCVKVASDHFKRSVPLNRLVFVTRCVVHHRLG